MCLPSDALLQHLPLVTPNVARDLEGLNVELITMKARQATCLGLPTQAGDMSLITGSGRSPGGGRGNPLQYSCLENPMERAAWRATVYRVAKSQIQLKQLSVQCRWGC